MQYAIYRRIAPGGNVGMLGGDAGPHTGTGPHVGTVGHVAPGGRVLASGIAPGTGPFEVLTI